MTPDIRPAASIDADWLTGVLAEGGVEARVRGFRSRPVGTGQIGDSIRFELDYERAPPEAPRSLVGKFPSLRPESRQTGVMLGNYHREVKFYQALAPRALVQVPRCWFADVDETSHDFVLMMEDLSPAQQGDQLRGVDLQTARLVTDQAARMHASFWGQDFLDDLPWVQGSKAAPAGVVNDEAIAAQWGGFRERYGERLRPEWIEVGEYLATRYGEITRSESGTRCLTHNDFRPDNMMFGGEDGGYPATILDWQSFSYGHGPSDLGYFLAGALPRHIRRTHESELLDLYVERLELYGARDVDPSDVRLWYGRGGATLLFTAFFAAMLVTRSERGDDMFMRMFGGGADHVLDHGVIG